MNDVIMQVTMATHSEHQAPLFNRRVVDCISLVPRPSLAPVFDRLQYAKTEGEGPVNLTT